MNKINQSRKIISVILLCFLLLQQFTPLGQVLNFKDDSIETAYADTSTSTNSNYATVTGKMSADGKSITWTATFNNAGYYHGSGMYNYFIVGSGLGAPTNITVNGAATSLYTNGSLYYAYRGYTAGKFTYQFTTPITDTTRTNYSMTVEDVNYTATYGTATATIDNKLTSVTVNKVWQDAPATKPSVTFDLYANGSTTALKSYIMASGMTSYTFTGLAKYDASGNPINYTVKERPVSGYTQSAKQNSATSWTFTNSNNVGTVSAKKTWLNVPTGTTKPTPSFTLTNLTTGQTFNNYTYDAATGKVSFANIQKVDANGKPYAFKIEEAPISGYYTSYSKNDVYGTKWSITNNYLGNSTTNCPIPMGVTSVSNTRFYPIRTLTDGSAYIGFNIDVSGTWSVPDSAKAGDTFTLQLPKEVNVQGTSQQFFLKASDGSIAGTGTIDRNTNLVTFTLSAYVDTHVNNGGIFELKGLQANYNYLPTAGNYNLTYTSTYKNAESCTRTFTNSTNIDYINVDGTKFTDMFQKGSKDVASETDTTITWRITIQGRRLYSQGYRSIIVYDDYDTYQTLSSVKVYKTQVYQNNGYNQDSMTQIYPTVSPYAQGFQVPLTINSTNDYVIVVTTNKKGTSPSGDYSNTMTLNDGYSVSAMTEHNSAESGTGSAATGSVFLKKVDGKQAPISGTEFTLYNADMKTVQGTLTTNAQGAIEFQNVPMGLYYLKETKAPTGYLLNSTIREVVVDENGIVTVNSNPNSSTSPAMIFNYSAANISKNINGDLTNYTTQTDTNFTFNIPVELPGDISSYNSFVVTDKLASQFDFVNGNNQIIVDGVYRNDIGTISYDAATRTVKLSITNFEALNGATRLTLRFDAKLNTTAVPNTPYTNTANLAYTSGSGTTGTVPSNPVTVQASENPAITLVKTTTTTKLPVVNQTIPYSLRFDNTGNTVLNKMTLTDDKVDLTGKTVTIYNETGTVVSTTAVNGSITLQPKQYAVLNYTYTVKQADVDAGKVLNTAKVVGTSPAGTTVTQTDDETVTGTSTPGIDLQKTSNMTQVTKVGDVIQYTFKITNNGQVTLSNVILNDAKAGISNVVVAPSLAVGQSVTYTKNYTVTQADLDRGQVVNSAVAKGTSPSNVIVQDPDQVTVPVVQTPKIDIVKTADEPTFSQLGETITYTFTIKNTGNVTLSNLNLTDAKLGMSATSVPTTTLAPGATTTYTKTYKVTQADLDNGQVLNSAVAEGMSPTAEKVTDPGEAVVKSDAQPQIALIKTVDLAVYSQVGQILTYTFEVTNTGPVTLNNVSINDAMFPGGVSLDKTKLAPGERTLGTATHTVTQEDIDKGEFINTATVEGFSPDNVSVTATDDVISEAAVTPIITVEKSSDINTVTRVGQVINYEIKATNTGDTSLYSVDIVDGLPGLENKTYEKIKVNGDIVSFDLRQQTAGIAPGESIIMKATYKATAADFANGKIYNEATAKATTLLDVPVEDTDDNTVTATSSPAIAIEKSSNVDTVDAVGDVIEYSLRATNTGNVELKNVNLIDDKVDLTKATFGVYEADGTTAVANVSTTNGQITLQPGQMVVATVAYVTTQADFDKGMVLNTATAKGTDPSNTPVEDTDKNTVTTPQTPLMSVKKSTTKILDKAGAVKDANAFSAVGDQLFYEFTFTNTGNQTITHINYSDNKLDFVNQVIDLTANPLLPGKTYTYAVTKPYVITQADIDNKRVTNTVVANGTTPSGPTPEVTDSNDTPADGHPEINVDKQLVAVKDLGVEVNQENAYHKAGDHILYKFVIENTGNTTINTVTIKDTKLNVNVTLDLTQAPYKPLAPSESMTYETELPPYKVTQADVDAGQVSNTVSVTAPEITEPVTDTNITPGQPEPDLTVDKVSTSSVNAPEIGKTYTKAGDTINYSFIITNTGNTTINEVTITDEKLGIKGLVVKLDTPLAPGAQMTHTVSEAYKVTQADVDAGNIVNTVSVSTPNDPTPATDTDEVPGSAITDITVDKKATQVTNASGTDLNGTFNTVGDLIYYEFVVTNNGQTTINEFTLNDAKLNIVNQLVPLPETLAPGVSYTHKVALPYKVTQRDIDNGMVVNAVYVSTPGDDTPGVDDTSVPGDSSPSITTDKVASESSVTGVGETIVYDIVSTNDGNTTLTNVLVEDGLPGLYAKVYSIENDKGETIQSGVINGQITLLPGQRVHMTAKYDVTTNDFAKGKIDNQATTTGTPPTGDPVSSQDNETVTAEAKPGIVLNKVSNISNFTNVGDMISYTMTATNTGNVDLIKVIIEDKKVDMTKAIFKIIDNNGDTIVNTGITNGQVTLEPGQALVAKVDYVTTQADLDAGNVLNTATTTGTTPANTPVTSTDDNEVSTNRQPSMSVHKLVTKVTNSTGTPYDSTTFQAAGDRVYYQYEFENTGNVTITEITFDDPLLGLSNRTFILDTPLAPGEKMTYQVPEYYTIKQADIDFGQVTNVVNAIGTTPAGPTPETKSDVTTSADGKPNLDVKKDVVSVANYAGVPYAENVYRAVGDIITYQFIVTNLGNTTIKQITVDDPMIGVNNLVVDLEVPLAPGESFTHVAKETHVVTQEDLDVGNVTNVVTISTPGDDTPAKDQTDTPGNQNADTQVVKRTLKVTNDAGEDQSGVFKAVGDRIYYAFDITNKGNTSIKEVTINDAKLGIKDLRVVFETPLAPTETTTYEVELPYVIKQTDIDAGQFVNTVTISTPGDDTPSTDDNETPGSQTPDVSVVKRTSKVTEANDVDLNGTFKNVGDKIYYSFDIKNEGNTTLTEVTINDSKLDIINERVTLTKPLQPGETYTHSVATPYLVTQADIDLGKVLNRVTVITPGDDTPATDDNETPGSREPAIEIQKNTRKVTDANGADQAGHFKQAGDFIYYEFIIKNTGNSSVNDVTVTDSKLGLNERVVNLPAPLAPGQSYPYIVEIPYVVTQEDVDAGQVLNTVTATTPGNPTPTTDDNETPGDKTPAVSVVKNVARISAVNTGMDLSAYQNVGDQIFYTFDIVNEGNTTLTEVTITDNLLGINELVVTLPTPLLPGQHYAYMVQNPYTVTQEDLDQGIVNNTVTVTTPNAPDPGTDDHEQPGASQPKIDLVKTSDKTTVTQVDETIKYTMNAVNSGNTTLNNVNIADGLTGLTNQTYDIMDVNDQIISANVSNGSVTLKPGQKLRLTADYSVIADDFATGRVLNVATATGQDPKDQPVEATDDNTVVATPNPKLELVKSSNVQTANNVGDEVIYSFEVTNTGNVTLTDVKVTDPMLEALNFAITLDKNELAPGEKATGTATYTLTQADIDRGEIINNAKAVGTPPAGDLVEDPDDNTVTVNQTPALDVTKETARVEDAAGTTYPTNTYKAVGDKVFYTFTFENTGTVSITELKITDERLGNTDRVISLPTPLLPGNTYTHTPAEFYTINQADIDGGTIKNIVTTTGTTPAGETPPANGEVDTPADGVPAVVLEKETAEVKSEDGTIYEDKRFTKAGDTISYVFYIKNIGNMTVNEVTVTDDKLGIQEVVTITDGLAPGATYTFTPTEIYTVTQEDVDNGNVLNTATAVIPGNDTPSTDENITNGDLISDIEVVKSADKTEVTQLDEVITYTFEVKNTGNTTLTDVKVNDPMIGKSITLAETTLAPGATTTGTATYNVTQTDLDAGNIHNVVTATGTPPNGTEPPTATDDVDVPVTRNAALELVKSSDFTTPKAVGETVVYTFKVTNTGNVTISNVNVTDKLLNDLGTVVSLDQTNLKPGEVATATAEYTVTQADVDKGSILNVATTTGTPPEGMTPPTDTDDETIETLSNPKLTIDKDATTTEFVKVGDIIEYTFTVTNIGNITVKDVVVSDPLINDLGLVVDLDKNVLAPGESAKATASYPVTQADVDAGKVVNTAKAEGKTPNDTPVDPVEDIHEVLGKPSSSIQLEKTSSTVNYSQVGDIIHYTFVVTNTGDVTLTDVNVTDPMIKDAIVLEKTELAPGESTRGTGQYTVTQADIDGGKVSNTATTTGTPPDDGDPNTPGLTPPTSTDTAEVESVVTPDISIEKSSTTETFVKVGDVIEYTFTITNTGNVTLKDIVVTDDKITEAITLQTTTLAPGGTTTGTAKYTVTQEDVNVGKVYNIASVTGTPPGESVPPTDKDDHEVVGKPTTSIQLEKTSDKTQFTQVGESVTYNFKVTNTGEVTLWDVTVIDEMLANIGKQVDLEDTVLAPGESTFGTVEYSITQADMDAGKVYNAATATGIPPGTMTPPTSEDMVTITGQGKPAIQLNKMA